MSDRVKSIFRADDGAKAIIDAGAHVAPSLILGLVTQIGAGLGLAVG